MLTQQKISPWILSWTSLSPFPRPAMSHADHTRDPWFVLYHKYRGLILPYIIKAHGSSSMTLEVHLRWAPLVVVFGMVSKAQEILQEWVHLFESSAICSFNSIPRETDLLVPFRQSRLEPLLLVVTLVYGVGCFLHSTARSKATDKRKTLGTLSYPGFLPEVVWLFAVSHTLSVLLMHN